MEHLCHCKSVFIIIIAIFVLIKINSILFKEFCITTPIIKPLSNQIKHCNGTDLYRTWDDIQITKCDNTQIKN